MILSNVKLALGTVQWGMPYGITNTDGQPDLISVEKIMDRAFTSGIDLLDTASAYGISEELLGRYVTEERSFRIVTKTVGLGNERIGDKEIERLKKGIDQSFMRLRRNKIYGILVHDAMELLLPGGERVFSELEALKQSNCVAKIGISAYSPDVVLKVTQKYPIDLVQVPLNLLDQRVVTSGILQKLKNEGVEIHVRSAFLQGTLLADIKTLPAKFNSIHKQFSLIEDVTKRAGLSKMALALSFIKRIPEVDRILVGVLNERQLEECLAAVNSDQIDEIDFRQFESHDLSIIDPSRWKFA